MFGFGKPSTIPSPADALPGRDTPIRTAERHYVNDTSIKPPYPAGSELATFALGCFWGEEKMFWEQPGVWRPRSATRRLHAEPDLRGVCTGRTGHAEAVRVVFDPAKTSYEPLLKVFWENHDPTQGMRQGNDRGTEYRSAIFVHHEAQRAPPSEARDMYQAAHGRRLRHDHDRDRRRPGLLLRRGLSPAVPREASTATARTTRPASGCRTTSS